MTFLFTRNETKSKNEIWKTALNLSLVKGKYLKNIPSVKRLSDFPLAGPSLLLDRLVLFFLVAEDQREAARCNGFVVDWVSLVLCLAQIQVPPTHTRVT